ncbi:MAG: bactofilin family protein [Candidatus Eutrophobiaceae bacterium]
MIGQHTEVLGDIRFSGGLLVDGTIKGNVFSEDDSSSALVLGETGTVEGRVQVPYLDVNGKIVGNVECSERIEMSSKSRIVGDVHYQMMEMQVGAEVSGNMVKMSSEEGSLSTVPTQQAKGEELI